MALVPRSPFDFDSFFGEDDWFLPVMSGARFTEPAMDLYETDKDVVAELNLPDIDPNDVEISVEHGMLRVRGETEEKKEEKDKKKGYWRKEIRKGSFERIARLPSSVNEDKVDATYAKGVLKIVMPKTENKKVEPKKIKVKEEK